MLKELDGILNFHLSALRLCGSFPAVDWAHKTVHSAPGGGGQWGAVLARLHIELEAMSLTKVFGIH